MACSSEHDTSNAKHTALPMHTASLHACNWQVAIEWVADECYVLLIAIIVRIGFIKRQVFRTRVARPPSSSDEIACLVDCDRWRKCLSACFKHVQCIGHVGNALSTTIVLLLLAHLGLMAC